MKNTQGRRQGGPGLLTLDPPFSMPFLSKQPTTDGKNAMTIWGVPLL